jgi:hypothetical protein
MSGNPTFQGKFREPRACGNYCQDRGLTKPHCVELAQRNRRAPAFSDATHVQKGRYGAWYSCDVWRRARALRSRGETQLSVLFRPRLGLREPSPYSMEKFL